MVKYTPGESFTVPQGDHFLPAASGSPYEKYFYDGNFKGVRGNY